MNDFSLLVRKKYEALDSEQKRMFDEEYNRRKKTLGDDYDNDLALDILRDIALTFGNVNSIQENKDVRVENASGRKTHGNSTHLPANEKSKESYLFNLVYVLIVGFIALIAFFYNKKVIVFEKQNRRECRDVAIYGFKDEVVHMDDCSEDGVELTRFHCLRWKGSGITIYRIVKKVEVDGVELKPLEE